MSLETDPDLLKKFEPAVVVHEDGWAECVSEDTTVVAEEVRMGGQVFDILRSMHDRRIIGFRWFVGRKV